MLFDRILTLSLTLYGAKPSPVTLVRTVVQLGIVLRMMLFYSHLGFRACATETLVCSR